MRGNITHIALVPYKIRRSQPLYQWDYGQILILDGLNLPAAYEVHFSCDESGTSVTQIGNENGVSIPDALLQTGNPIHVWLYLHQGENDGETEVHGILPVVQRARPTNSTPTPVQQDVITETIAALNAAVAEAERIAEAIPGTVNDALAEAKASGEFDGYSPSASVSKVGHTSTITITDKEGTTTAQVTDGVDGNPGEDGYSPSASVSKNGNKATISITDKNGTTTAEISDGQDGQDGDPGADGYSPTATVTKSGSTATITITDKNGTTTAQISDGTSGDPSALIDDTAGSGVTSKTWSADKLTTEFGSTLSALQSEATYRQALGSQIADNDLVTLICPCVLEIANTTIDTSTGKRISMTGMTTRYYETGYANADVVLSYYSKYAFYSVLPDTQTASIDGVAHVGPGTNVKTTLINGTKFIGIATQSSLDAPVVKTTNIGITELINDFLFANIEHYQITASANVQSGCTVNSDGSISVPAGAYYFRVFNLNTLMGDGYFNIKMSPLMDVNIYKNSSTSGGGIDGYAVATPKENGSVEATVPHSAIEENYPYAVVRIDNRLGENGITIYSIDLLDYHVTIPRAKWVSTYGDDSNEGTESSPFATVNNALKSGASVVMLMQGVYMQQIDLAYAKNPNIELRCGEPYKKVIFKDPDSVMVTSETKVSDTTKVYSATVTASINENINWIYQEGIADAETLISDAKRHPLERGYTYRCEDTKIDKCTSDNVTDAIAEIDSSDEYKWFLDDGNNIIYYSRPQTVSSEHPICYSTGKTLFSNGSKSIPLKAVGIESKYMVFNINDLSSAELLECKSTNVFGDGAFVYDRCQSSKFVRCEAARCQNGVIGDGFNGHSTNSGDTFSKQTDTTLIDCWAHDNNDDGYSDHERCEVSLFGGLYEYNHKGGVMPSYGSHCMCYDVLSRNNYNGFYCAGEATVAEGGKGTQMWCYNCIAEDNDTPGANYGSGFVVSNSGNSAVLINCKAIGNEIGYSCFNTATMKIIDCGGRLNTTLKAGTIEIENTTIVV